ncbi:MAG: hypothetical protein HXX08_08285 [Chloroflexi bacterium]|uniref:Uncharacterized protein n=1 Tax=Candidatus Chlorohelix allophototropha TaxID=3003348 RepID=A0A8T7M203_9CHLR|nr:hypothetical protein [Chloroflexota bacterium]WJW67725.1 hypothetical protein OZ401_001000 [Chloroflexota bacterium L227-S17]
MRQKKLTIILVGLLILALVNLPYIIAFFRRKKYTERIEIPSPPYYPEDQSGVYYTSGEVKMIGHKK